MDIRTRRAFDEMAENDGFRVLIDRIWPRGVAKEDLDLDDWCKDVAPSNDLRKWFDHDAGRWHEFKRRYRKELDRNDAVKALLDKACDGRVTLERVASNRFHTQRL